MKMLTLLSPLPKSQQRSNAGVDSKSSSAKGIKTYEEPAARAASLPVHALIVQNLEEPSHQSLVVNAHPAGLGPSSARVVLELTRSLRKPFWGSSPLSLASDLYSKNRGN